MKEHSFLSSKIKDSNVQKELMTVTIGEKDIEFYFFKQLFTGKTIYNKVLIEKEEFFEFMKKEIEEDANNKNK
jgi:hypothetical protein